MCSVMGRATAKLKQNLLKIKYHTLIMQISFPHKYQEFVSDTTKQFVNKSISHGTFSPVTVKMLVTSTNTSYNIIACHNWTHQLILAPKINRFATLNVTVVVITNAQ